MSNDQMYSISGVIFLAASFISDSHAAGIAAFICFLVALVTKPKP